MTLTVKQGQQQNYNTSLKSKNGTYTVGMTRAQAQKDGSYKAMFGIDYNDLDKDKNGILSQEEILQGRVESAKRDRNMHYAVAAMVGTAGVIGCAAETVSTFGLGLGAGIATAGGCSVVAAATARKGLDVMKEAEQELQNYYNDSSAQKLDAKRKLDCEF